MQANTPPVKIPVAFADAGTKNTIPTESQIGITPGRASLVTGFPPLTMTPVQAGGIPPSGADFNGILNRVTDQLRWQSAGGLFKFDMTFASAVGGYPKGAMLARADNAGCWLSLVDNNIANPDTGGSGWMRWNANAFMGKSQEFIGAGTYTFTTGEGVYLLTLCGTAPGGGGAGGTGNSGGQTSLVGGGGGGAGGAGQSIFQKQYVVAPSTAYMVTIGAPGIAGAQNVNGGNAGNAQFGSLVTLLGGSGGMTGGAVQTDQAGRGGAGGFGGAGYPYGGDGSDGNFAGNGGNGASGPFGGGGPGGRAGNSGAGGFPGRAPFGYGAGGGGGGGGYGAASANIPGSAGAAGAPGYILVLW